MAIPRSCSPGPPARTLPVLEVLPPAGRGRSYAAGTRDGALTWKKRRGPAVERPDWLAEEFDPDQPNPARVYDYFLGGSHNLAADREAAARILAAMPDAALMNQANRAFLRRAVLDCVQAGVRQFLDLRSGIPTR